jgi:glycosyltransferase involved in cell wall biosynthesis
MTQRKLRVLIVAPSLDILGGQSVQAARLIERLSAEPLLQVGFLPINPRLPGVLRRLQGIKYVRTVVTSMVYVSSLLLQVRKYDVIHVFSASYFSFVLAPTPAILIGKLFRKKVLLNYHSGEAEDHLRRWRSAVATIRLADSVVVPSEYLVRVLGSFGLKARAIFNLVDLKKFRFRERVPLQPIFLSNRNLERHYGVDCVLRAFATIQKSFSLARLTIAGDGSQSLALKNLAKQLDLRNISFIGRVNPESILDVYDAADVYLNGSSIDNQPLSIIEAFCCGLPIVTTEAGGIPDMVRDGETGLLVPCDAHAEMAERAIRLLNHPDLARRLVGHARNEVQKYQWETVRDAWISAYFDLKNEGRIRPASEAEDIPRPPSEHRALSK